MLQAVARRGPLKHSLDLSGINGLEKREPRALFATENECPKPYRFQLDESLRNNAVIPENPERLTATKNRRLHLFFVLLEGAAGFSLLNHSAGPDSSQFRIPAQSCETK